MVSTEIIQHSSHIWIFLSYYKYFIYCLKLFTRARTPSFDLSCQLLVNYQMLPKIPDFPTGNSGNLVFFINLVFLLYILSYKEKYFMIVTTNIWKVLQDLLLSNKTYFRHFSYTLFLFSLSLFVNCFDPNYIIPL